MAGQSLVFVIDGNLEERNQIAAAIETHYQVSDYGDLDAAILGLSGKRPVALVIDERIRAPGLEPLIPALRSAFKDIPIILCAAPGRKKDGVEVQLDKPFRRSRLINALSALANRTIEDGWTALPAPHAATLRNSIDTFNHIAELIEVGEPLVYDQVVDTCAPLVEAVTGSHYKPLLGAIRDHDNATYVHSLRVATLLSLLGHTIGVKDDALLILATGGLLHDLGKSAAIQDLINQPRKLDAEEMAIVQTHVTVTLDYLKEQPDVPKGVLTIAAQHHERLDGSGYPAGLAGGQINDLARMAAIVDVFSALTERRSYRPAFSPEKAFATMRAEMQTSLDQNLVAMFHKTLADAACDGWS
jgi:putative nucleotidyltransferase with HDIG domain